MDIKRGTNACTRRLSWVIDGSYEQSCRKGFTALIFSGEQMHA